MRLAVSKNGKDVLESKIIPTPKDFWEGMDIIKKTSYQLVKGERIDAAAGGIAGPLDKKRTMLTASPNLPGWVEKPLKEELERATASVVHIENDTAIVGLGEAVVGAGAGFSIVAYVTISTGVGGARIVDEKIDRNAFGFEIGHHIINFSGDNKCSSCDTMGHLEAYVSGSALESFFEKKPYEITDPTVWEETAKILAYGLNNVAVFWSPDIIVLGGSMIVGNPAIPMDRIKHHLEENLKIFPEIPKVEKAVLGDVGGLYGAMEYLRQSS